MWHTILYMAAAYVVGFVTRPFVVARFLKFAARFSDKPQ